MNNIKKLITSITLGLVVVAGIGTTATIANATSEQITSYSDEDPSIEMFNTDFEKSSSMSAQEWTQYLMNQGVVTQEEGLIELAYHNSNDDSEKQKLYEDLINLQLKNRNITEEEAQSLRQLRHDDESQSYSVDLMLE